MSTLSSKTLLVYPTIVRYDSQYFKPKVLNKFHTILQNCDHQLVPTNLITSLKC